jgi:nucleoside-diphosphate kinase
MERTFVMLKPDAVQRSVSGEIIQRFEKAGFKIIAMKMLKPDKTLVSKHYPGSKEYLETLGGKTKNDYLKYGLSVGEVFGSDDSFEIGKKIKEWLVDFICSGSVIAMVLEGNHAVSMVRKLVGSTMPSDAQPGTIRGDYSIESADIANFEKRPVRNLIHASGNIEEASFEIKLWFPDLK